MAVFNRLVHTLLVSEACSLGLLFDQSNDGDSTRRILFAWVLTMV